MEHKQTSPFSEIELNYRTLYGKLYASLLSTFGVKYSNQIEDAIQNSFYKSLKTWLPNKTPENRENWLFIVARNDLITQLKKETKGIPNHFSSTANDTSKVPQEDLRLQTMLLVASIKNLSSQTKILFIIKNIFGLHIKEISQCTLISHAAIYKSIKRAKTIISNSHENEKIDINNLILGYQEIGMVEEILYAIFNIGFDSFNEKAEAVINDGLCLEALALAKMLYTKFNYTTTKNLIALFCFHLARIPAKLSDGKFIPFFEQEISKWNQPLINLGFHYLEEPTTLNQYYIEALITSKHMTTKVMDISHWEEIIKLYELLITITNSPIAKINLCYCLNKAKKNNKALAILGEIEKELPKDHFYHSLVKADLLNQNNAIESNKIRTNMRDGVSQKIRKNLISKYIISASHQNYTT